MIDGITALGIMLWVFPWAILSLPYALTSGAKSSKQLWIGFAAWTIISFVMSVGLAHAVFTIK